MCIDQEFSPYLNPKARPHGSPTARIERPPLYRGGSASKGIHGEVPCLLSPLMASCDPLEAGMEHLLEYAGSVHIYLGPYRGNPISLYLKRTETGCQIGPKAYPWNDVVGRGETPNKAAADFEEKWKAKGLSADMYSGPSWEGGIKPEKPVPPKPPAPPPKPATPTAAAPTAPPAVPPATVASPSDGTPDSAQDVADQPAIKSS